MKTQLTDTQSALKR